MEAQEIFDKVAEHLATQKRPSLRSSGCAYRGDEGRKCAFGIFIPDADYTKDFEGSTSDVFFDAVARAGAHDLQGCHFEAAGGGVSVRLSENFVTVLKDLQPHARLVRALQRTHDQSHWYTWVLDLTSVAHQHGLNFDRDAFEQKLKAE